MKWFIRILLTFLLLFLSSFLAYFLPSRDIVQIVGTDVKRMDIGDRPWFWDKPDAGTQSITTREVRFINAERANGSSRVYRNEDTDWSFPPYFKFNSADLSAKAQGLAKQNKTVWVAVSHYGWRVRLVSMYPNAYKIKRVSGPDALLIPWFNIVFLSFLAFILINIWLMIRRFKKKRLDPIAEKIGDVADDVGEDISKGGNAISKFFRRWFGSRK